MNGPQRDAEPPVDEIDSFDTLVNTARRSIVDGARRTRKESAIVAEILAYLNGLPRSVARKVHQDAISGGGEPDIDACVRGRTLKLEVKRPGETPTGRQRKRLEHWQRAGALVGWATSLAEAAQIVDRADDWDALNPLTSPGWPDAPPG
jgi:hypothetical protein